MILLKCALTDELLEKGNNLKLLELGKGTLRLRGMFSFEPFTFPPGGSPLLFQTGETYKGQPLNDKQHPHDLFMELSALRKGVCWVMSSLSFQRLVTENLQS